MFAVRHVDVSLRLVLETLGSEEHFGRVMLDSLGVAAAQLAIDVRRHGVYVELMCHFFSLIWVAPHFP